MEDDDILDSIFICSRCAHETSVLEFMERKIHALRERQLQLEEECRDLSLKCESLRRGIGVSRVTALKSVRRYTRRETGLSWQCFCG